MDSVVLKLLATCLCIFVLAGCSCFKEVYHIKARDGDNTNYFRVTVSGWSFLSSSQYAAGNYDADAVDALFGELQGAKVRADSSKLLGHTPREGTSGSAATDQGPSAGSPAHLETFTGESLDRKKFVFFLSSNSDFFVNQISTYVTTREMQESIVTLILKEDLSRLEKERINERSYNAATSVLATQLRSIASELRHPSAAGTTNNDAKKEAVRVLKMLARKSSVLSGVESIDSVGNAKKWLQDHPRAFVEGVNP